MTENGPEPHEVPRDPVLKEAFDAFIQQTQVPVDFHARVMERVQQQPARQARGKRKPRGVWRKSLMLKSIPSMTSNVRKAIEELNQECIEAERLNSDSD